MNSNSPRVAILSHADISFFELGCAVELFALPRPEFEHWYQTDIVNLDDRPITTTGSIVMHTQHVDDLERYDMLVVPSWPTQPTSIDNHLRQQITLFAAQNKRILSFCSGAFLLAELGLLEGKQATTHWAFEHKFRQRFPQVNYASNVLYVFDDKLGCSAGSAAGLDLGLAVIREDFGYTIANQVAKRLVVSAHRSGGQAQFVDTPMLQVPNQFSQALDWAKANLTKPIHIDTLASKANMSRRTFDRKFRSSMNITPQEWLIKQRTELAKGLLESEEINIEQLAQKAGFNNAVSMRHHFKRIVGVSPKQYRTQFNSG
ncbi:helix-turn-helix domain-containing protein [Vibrio sp. 404]|uniref:Helix-turn-helix domain-containing protein n=1 Tax=Vibrio marinisediminis TaxID=2758441 RepID=A0A7W2FMY2_9VIBR|nr:helix-turn-helix domain-containing protein [Vibrio marinisediminis]MBA5761053.1 helix-turn-helix domain-containing protein [Vibrio marinisediminis]